MTAKAKGKGLLASNAEVLGRNKEGSLRCGSTEAVEPPVGMRAKGKDKNQSAAHERLTFMQVADRDIDKGKRGLASIW
jgi:hypothetical protein